LLNSGEELFKTFSKEFFAMLCHNGVIWK